MTLELAVFISATAMLFNLATLWAFSRLRSDHEEITKRLFARINYLEIGMSYHELIPLPWEIGVESLQHEENKNFKRDGNVIYLEE
jgi:hypothetical protein